MPASAPLFHVGPVGEEGLEEAVRRGGGTLTADPAAAEVLVVTRGADGLADMDHDGVRWVQLRSAGVEQFVTAGVLRPGVVVTSATGAYAATCAEHCLALLLALTRRLDQAAADRTWTRRQVTTLAGAGLVVVGAGGIGAELIRLVAPFGMDVTAVTRTGHPVEGAHRAVAVDELLDVLPEADLVVDVAPDTPATRGLLGAAAFAAMPGHAYVVNVGRGPTIATDDLVTALRDGAIAGAGLDVTDPEPLPDGHPLWTAPRTIVTSHTANPDTLNQAALADRVTENVRRYLAGRPLLGEVRLDRGY